MRTRRLFTIIMICALVTVAALGSRRSTLDTTHAWMAEGNKAETAFGTSVGTAGDVNHDGSADDDVGAPDSVDPIFMLQADHPSAALRRSAGVSAFWSLDSSPARAMFWSLDSSPSRSYFHAPSGPPQRRPACSLAGEAREQAVPLAPPAPHSSAGQVALRRSAGGRWGGPARAILDLLRL